jgi:hypothetical protein
MNRILLGWKILKYVYLHWIRYLISWKVAWTAISWGRNNFENIVPTQIFHSQKSMDQYLLAPCLEFRLRSLSKINFFLLSFCSSYKTRRSGLRYWQKRE